MLDSSYKRNKVCGGFTLLELLVSITILSLIITISYSALRLGTRSWDASIKNINNNSNKRSAIELIKNKVEHTYPIYWKINSKKVLAFRGDEESVQFIAPSPQGREVGEYFEYLLVIDKSLTETTLELYYEPHDPGADSFIVDRNSPNRAILTGLNNARFAYYGKGEVNGQEEWFSEWENDSATLPTAIQIVLLGKNNTDINVDMVIKYQSELYQL